MIVARRRRLAVRRERVMGGFLLAGRDAVSIIVDESSRQAK
jgi:hypothetical protein